MTILIRRGDLWSANFGDPESPEAGYQRPILVVSSDRMRSGRLAIVCPLTTTPKPYPWRIEIEADEGNGLTHTGYIQVEHLRAISSARLVHRIGQVGTVTRASAKSCFMRSGPG